MFRKITAIALGAVIAAGSCVCAASACVPTTAQTVSQSTAAAEWNGKTAPKAGKSYIVSNSVTVSKKITIPASTTITVKKGGKLTVSSAGTLNIKGTFSVSSAGTATINGKLYLYKGAALNTSGTLKLGKTSVITLKGKTSVNVGGKLSGTPKTLTVSDTAEFAVKGTNSCAKLAKEITKQDIAKLYKEYITSTLKDNDFMTAYTDAYPEKYIQYVEALLEENGATFKLFCDEMGKETASAQEEAGYPAKDIKSVKVEVTKYTDITGKEPADVKEFLACGYDNCEGVVKAELKVTLTLKSGKKEQISWTVYTAFADGRWYLVDG